MREIIQTYTAYGLNISSAIRLPDLLIGSAPADVSIRLGEITDAHLNEFKDSRIFENPGVKVRVSRRGMFFEWNKLGKVLVRDGWEVIVQSDQETLEDDWHPFLTGPVLAVLLHQRGFFVLHASAVEVFGTTLVFMGAKGEGKSTLAGCLKAKGHRLISDDIAPVSFAGRASRTIPGFPRIKLYDDSISAIGARPLDYPTIHRFVEKRSFQFNEPFCTAPVRLQGAFILSAAETVEIEKMNPAESFVQVMANTHLNRFLETLQCQSEYFRHCRNFVSSVPVFRLRRPLDFCRTGEVIEQLENFAREAGRGAALKNAA
jgi:hypothetical protein